MRHMFSRHAQRRTRPMRGVTLFEVLIVVAILALVASGVGIAALERWRASQQRAAETSARALRHAAKSWFIDHDSSTCPGVEQLVSDGVLDKDSPHRDPWGGEWRLECTGDEVTVISQGADRRAGTLDDIRIPPT